MTTLGLEQWFVRHIVEPALRLDPFAPACFVFSNKRRDRINLLSCIATASGYA